jgi:5-methylcytosine-specific restriction enzyme subunit McrC
MNEMKPLQIREHESFEIALKAAHNVPQSIFFKNNQKDCCLEVLAQSDTQIKVKANYYIGVDWVIPNEQAIYVEPKLNDDNQQTDYLKMLLSALQRADIGLQDTKELFEIKFDAPFVEINRQQDLLTPLLILQFLHVVKDIVRKGLKKSYYRVENNLNGRVKGKILIAQTLKKNIVQNKNTQTICQYEVFGYDGLENRLLKKTLIFIQRYLGTLKMEQSVFQNLFQYIMPAFVDVSDAVELHDIKHTKMNPFYRTYEEAIEMARLILRRFGYNIDSIALNQRIKVPPFWIDMSKLFELYVLGLLKERFKMYILYHKKGNYGEVDYLITTPDCKMIVDAKYKVYYKEPFTGQEQWKRDVIAKDIRQLSGYARDATILNHLDVLPNQIVDCLIIYPDQTREEALAIDLKSIPIAEFVQFYKTAVKLPLLS